MKYHFKIEKLPPKASNFYFDWIDFMTQRALGRTVAGSTIFALFVDVDGEWRVAGWGCVKCQRGNWYLGLTYVKESYRGNGFQRELIKERIQWCRSYGVKTLRCGVKPDNTISRKNVLAMGFEFEKKRPEFNVYTLEL
jgi:GNAT superfamily N-acetyltransferase